jgi:predicted Zn finger-like uncharacterized protein
LIFERFIIDDIQDAQFRDNASPSMSMTTQCPSCGTTFRVTPPQLQSQHGMVRCGRCATVFDGFKALATLQDDTALEAAPPLALALPEVDAQAPKPVAAAESVAPEQVAEEPVAVAQPAAASKDVTQAVPAVTAPVLEIAGRATRADVSEPAIAVQDETIESQLEPPAPRRRGIAWACGALLLLVGLAAQLTYLYRSELAVAVPEARPYLNEWCKPLRCTVALPQRPRQISIEASDMQAADTASPGLVILTATLRNQATTTLGYPALDVVLTNTREHTVARRIFFPAEYLAGSRDSRAGIASGGEITVRLHIDSGDLGAAGFRLELLTAPAT